MNADRALLLRRTPYGETSLVVHALTARHGRIELIAKGAFRPKSRFCGVLDWFDTLLLEWAEPRAAARGTESRLRALSAGDLHTRRRTLTRSLDAYRAAQTTIELLEVATRAGFADGALFELGERALDALDTPRAEAARARVHATQVLTAFELHLLRELGLVPALRRCAVCGEPAEVAAETGDGKRVFFSTQSGGRLCARHASEAHATGRRVGTLPLAVLERAAALLQAPLGAAPEPPSVDPSGAAPGPDFAGGQGTADDGLAERVLDFVGRFLDHQLETRPRSHRRFLSAPDRNRRSRA